MLHGKLVLHDVRDIEAFCARIVDRSRLELTHHDREDLLAYLVAESWELSLDFRPGKATFQQYAGARLQWRLAEWKRNRNGRTVWKFKDRVHTRPAIKLESYEQHTTSRRGRGHSQHLREDSRDDQMERAVSRFDLDIEERHSSELLRVLLCGDSSSTGDVKSRNTAKRRKAA